MNTTSFLDQLLKTGAAAFENVSTGMQPGDGRKVAAGVAVGGALGLLLGSSGGRRLGGRLLKVGSAVALGSLAWKAYGDWQRQNANAGAAAATSSPPPAAAAGGYAALSAPQAELHGRAMLKALIAAAKSDGHMDDGERGRVEAALQQLNADAELRSWVEAELRRPVDPADVAAAATGTEMAAEIYLTSVVAVDETTTMERAYLDELARQLQLPPDLKAELEHRAAAA